MNLKTLILLCVLLCINASCNTESDLIDDSFQEEGFDNVTLAKWMYDADIAVSFTWDDANESQFRIIAPLFEKYQYRATFFIQTNVLHDVRWNTIYINGYRSIVERRHEVGSHTFQHLSLKSLRELDLVRRQLVQSKEDIKNYLGYSPISFCHPFNEFEMRVDTLVDQYYLNSRFSSIKNVGRREVFTMMKGQDVRVLKKQLNKLDGIEKDWMIYAGHGVDGYGYSPIDSYVLDQCLSDLSQYNRKDLWIIPFGEAAVYEYLYQHTVLKVDNKLLTFDITAAEERLSQLGVNERVLSVKIKEKYDTDYLSDGIIDIKRKGDFVILTIDLTKSTEIRMVKNNIKNI